MIQQIRKWINGSFPLYIRTLKFGRPYIRLMLLKTVVHSGSLAVDLGVLYFIKILIDAKEKIWAPDQLKLASLMGLGLVMVRSGLGYVSGYLSLRIDSGMANDLRNRIFAAIEQQPLHFHASHSTGDLMTLVFYHAENMLQIITSLSGTLVQELIRIPLLMGLLLYLHPDLTFLSLAIFLPIFWMIRKFRSLTIRRTRDIHEMLSNLYSRTEQVLSHMEIIKIFAEEDREIAHFRQMNSDYLSRTLHGYRSTALASPLFQLLKMAGVAMLVFVGAMEVGNGRISPGQLMVFLASAYMLYGAITSLVSWYLSQIAALESAAKVYQVLDQDTTPSAKFYPIPTFLESIEFHHVTFVYPLADHPAISDITLKIDKGQTIAIAGPSGSGKSTLIKLMLKLYLPDSGTIFIDQTPYTVVDGKSLKGLFGVAPQDHGIFQATIREAVTFGCGGDVSEEKIGTCLFLAGADTFIRDLPNGLDTPIGKQGMTLSGGEKQRIALARALLRDPEILVLDEGLSSVDGPTERLVLERIANYRQGKTNIFISHRSTVVAHAHRIIALKNGRLVESEAQKLF